MTRNRKTVAEADRMNQSNRFFAVTMTLVVLGALGTLTLDWLLRAETLPLESVSFSGPFKKVSRAQLERILLPHIEGNYLMLDLTSAQNAIERAPWIYRASIRRDWPNGIHIQYSEQTIAAHWKETDWLNKQGEIVKLGDQFPEGSTLPHLSGPEGYGPAVLKQYRQLSESFSAVGLRVVGLSYTSRRSWRIDIDHGMQILMGREDSEKTIQRFVQVYSRLLASKVKQIKRVDLRYTNGFAVEWLDQKTLSHQLPDAESKQS